MKKSKHTISDWLDKYSNPKIDKQVEKELEEIITKHQTEMKNYENSAKIVFYSMICAICIIVLNIIGLFLYH